MPHPTSVGLFHAPADQIHDGFTLAAYLNSIGQGCALRRFWPGTPRGLALDELSGAASRLMLLSVGEENLAQVLRLVEPLSRRREVLLFGRQLHDPELRERALVEGVAGLVVGDPRPVCRGLTRRLEAGDETVTGAPLAGLHRPGEEGAPLEPPRHLDSYPPGDYSHELAQVQMAVPLRSSLGFPFPAAPMAERLWEAPLRGISPERMAEIIAHHVQEHGARRFLFTDLAANAAGDDLLRLARLLDADGLGRRIRWFATVWPDPSLDRGALNLLRRAGCRGLRLLVWTGSAALARELKLGVDPEAALRICRDATLEGVDVRPMLQVGFPGEEEEHRQATHAWLARASEDLLAVDGLAQCELRSCSPMGRTDGVYFPAEEPARQWHDGGANNRPQRAVWVREARTVCGGLDLDHPGKASRQFSALSEPGVRRRLEGALSGELAASNEWRRRWLHLAGVLHGREAFCGPREIQLDLGPDMELDDALSVVEQAAAMGARVLALGHAGAAMGQDASRHPGLLDLLRRARELRLEVLLRTRLPDLDQPVLAAIRDGVQQVQITATTPGEVEALIERGVAQALAEWRVDRELRLPRLELHAAVCPALPRPAYLVETALELGVDRLVLGLDRSEQARLEPAAVAVAAEELDTLMTSALLVQEAPDALLLARTGKGWPAGFVLTGQEGDAPLACSCPAGKSARRMVIPDALSGAALARYSEADCQLCEHLDACPVNRLDFSVTLSPLQVLGAASMARDLTQEDLGLGHAERTAERRPCLAGWESARITASGELFLCPVCGDDPVGNVLEEGLAGVWYSRGLNEFRRMSVGASLALPYIDRSICARGCGRQGQDQRLIDQIRALSRDQLASLESAGSGDRL